MNKRNLSILTVKIRTFFLGIIEFLAFFTFYLKKKVVFSSNFFESSKNSFIKLFMIKRGRYSRLFLHFATIGVLGVGILITPFLASTYPVFSESEDVLTIASSDSKQSITVGADVFQTEISQKPRDKVIEYTVQKGDTVSTIARKFNISQDTIKWASGLNNDNITVGDKLKILPVSGIWHKVQSGESVYTIAKKYDSNPQQIVDFPFNDFANPETFSLVEGQMLLVPDGIKPEEIPVYRKTPRTTYIAQGPVSVSSAGFSWPIRGGISQYSSWYHVGIDITNSVGVAVVAAKSGQVIKVSTGTWDGGYGNNVAIDHGDGTQTLYAHLSSVYVSVGDSVEGGKSSIAAVGMTGRTTGAHLHFEVRQNGGLINPMGVLQ